MKFVSRGPCYKQSLRAMIELGLARISRLLGESVLPWRAIHVAGTNGKGSVCAYASSMLHACGVPCGRFTSPHLIDRWDCITVNEEVVEESLFRQTERRVQLKNENEGIKAAEFELLTAIAFEIFAQEKIKIGVVEVGLGGRLDATNIMKDPLVTVISKIGKDHEVLLGSTFSEIAYQKAGVLKPDVPAIVDGTNHEDVLSVIADVSKSTKSGMVKYVEEVNGQPQSEIWTVQSRAAYQRHQQMNISLAYEAVTLSLKQIQLSFNPEQLATAIQHTSWQGRLQMLSIKPLTGRTQPILLDGAHNAQSAVVLGSYVDERIREIRKPVTWIVAISKGKDLQEILPALLKKGDILVVVEFGPVDQMPWVQPMPAEEILDTARAMVELECSWAAQGSLRDALRIAAETAGDRPMVIAGSLYLVSDVLRLLRYS
ncbi:folylpolyglutamate synthase [Xylographa opegraphella]|nr:folylpolyglutamate synthase [Xylographa opegraphella]